MNSADFCSMSLPLIILIAVLLMLIGIAFLRIRIIIDTFGDRYEIQLIPLARARLVFDDGTIGYRWNAVFIKREGQLFPPVGKEEKPEKKKAKKKNKSRMSLEKVVRFAQVLYRSVRVRRFYLRLNMDNAIWNAWLFPAFSIWRSRGYDVAIRFVGSTDMVLDIDNSVHRIAGAFLHSYITKSN